VTPKICVSILPKDTAEALNIIEKSEKAKANLIEIRLDFLPASSNLRDMAASTKLPLIATNKLASENGFFRRTETERQQTLIDAAKAGFAYVDVSLLNPKKQETIKKLEHTDAQPIVSYHDNGPMSIPEMEKVLQEEIFSGASVCKIVGTAQKMDDNLAALNFVTTHSDKTKLVCFCMGKTGKVSRLLSPLCGAFFTFASIGQGNETAQGQMTINEMRAAYQLLGV
jgi:3-dehydroquinate dehydratase type I